MTHNAGHTIVGGYSDGGAAAAFVAMKRPRSDQTGIPGYSVPGNSDVGAALFIEAGVLKDSAQDGVSLLAANRNFVEVLTEKRYQVTYEEFGGTHEPVHWRDALQED